MANRTERSGTVKLDNYCTMINESMNLSSQYTLVKTKAWLFIQKWYCVSIQLHTDKNSNLVNIKRPYINRFDYIMLYFQSSICMLSLDSMFLTNTVIKILQKRKEIVCCVKLNTEISTQHSKPLYNVSLIYKKIVTVEEHFLYLTHL